MREVTRDTIDGFERITLSSDSVEIQVLPALGAKITSLLHRPTGRQWMWTARANPRYRPVPTGALFDQGTLVGADECLPTIEPCRWRGLELTDHGEVWTEAWELDEIETDRGRIATTVRTPISPLRFSRVLSLDRNVIRFDYALTSEEPFEYIWAFHPLMTIEAGDRIELSPTCQQVCTELCLGGCPLGVRGDRWQWPNPQPAIDLSRYDLGGPDRAVKLYTEPVSDGQAAIHNADSGARIQFAFDASQINTLGIWINRGGWNGYHHVALEPASGAPDALDAAVKQWHRFGQLRPRQTRRWSFTIQLSGP